MMKTRGLSKKGACGRSIDAEPKAQPTKEEAQEGGKRKAPNVGVEPTAFRLRV